MRITIETENEPQPSKPVLRPTDAQASGGPAPARAAVTPTLSLHGESMSLNGGRAPSMATLARSAGASRPRLEHQRPGAAVTDAGAAPQGLKPARSAPAGPQNAGQPKPARKQK